MLVIFKLFSDPVSLQSKYLFVFCLFICFVFQEKKEKKELTLKYAFKKKKVVNLLKIEVTGPLPSVQQALCAHEFF